jgi:wyosine [tRNA(Phe)-imidazoG37] synthetase (radical SAM superfamily)
MLIRGLNDSEAALTDLAGALESIAPDEVHLLLPERPPSSEWVAPADEEGVMRATAILGAALPVVHPQHGRFDRTAFSSLSEAIVAVVTRHPMREEELTRMLADPGEEERIVPALEHLQAEGRIQPVLRQGQRFWGPGGGHY